MDKHVFVLHSNSKITKSNKTLCRSTRSCLTYLFSQQIESSPVFSFVRTNTQDVLSFEDPIPEKVIKEHCVEIVFNPLAWGTLMQMDNNTSKSCETVVLNFDALRLKLDSIADCSDLLNLLLDDRILVIRDDGTVLLPDDPISWTNTCLEVNSGRCKECAIKDERIAYLEQRISILLKSRKDVLEKKVTTCGKKPVKIESSGLSLNVPANVLGEPSAFAIDNAPTAIIENLDNLFTQYDRHSPIYSIEPHNTVFKVPVELEFEVEENLEKPAIFIQQDLKEHRDVNALLQVPSTKVGRKVKLNVQRFSFIFVADDIGNEVATVSTKSPNSISSGLNYRGICQNVGCTQKGKYVTHNVGYCSGLDASKIIESRCLVCNSQFKPRQLVFCNSVIKISYQLLRQSVQHFNEQVVDKILCVVGDPSINPTSKYESFSIDCKPPVYNAGVGNNLSDTDACRDGALAGFSVLVYTNPHIYSHFDLTAGSVLKQKGMSYKMVATDDAEFIRLLPNFDIAWVIGFNSSVHSGFADACIEHHRKGKGLYLWGDDYLYDQTNTVLRKLFSFELTGCTTANKLLERDWILGAGKFLNNHIITTGIPTLYEGVTICYPTNLPPQFKVLAHSSDGHPCIMYLDKENGCGRILIDCGWTKLYSTSVGHYWDRTPGTARYVCNASCWLAGYDVSNTYYTL